MSGDCRAEEGARRQVTRLLRDKDEAVQACRGGSEGARDQGRGPSARGEHCQSAMSGLQGLHGGEMRDKENSSPVTGWSSR